MSKKSGSGSGPFLMEMLVVVGFFIICASICVLVFVKADNISKDARDINQAVLKAQSLAEELKAGQALRWSEMLPDRNIWEHLADADGGNQEQVQWNQELVQSEGYEGIHTMYWNSSWEETEPDSEPAFLGVIYTGTVDKMERADILIVRYGRGANKGKMLYRLQTETYAGS